MGLIEVGADLLWEHCLSCFVSYIRCVLFIPGYPSIQHGVVLESGNS